MASRQNPSRQAPPSRQAAPARHTEIETKLEFDPGLPLPELDRVPALAAAGLTACGPEVRHELDAVYYDTDQLDLLRGKVTLRRRTGGEDAGWHLKLPGGGAGTRTELRLPLADGGPGEVPAALANLVRGTARGRVLGAVARLENHRTVRELLAKDGTELIEVADDEVTATRLGAGDVAPQQWRELEVEILGGTREQLAATVEVLLAGGARPASSASKLGRALPLPEQAPVKSRKTAGGAVIAAVARQRDALIAADRGIRDGSSDALHDARSLARRLRSVLTVYERLFDADVTSRLCGGLAELGSVLAGVRDLEVALRRMQAQLADEPEEYGTRAQARLNSEMTALLTTARAAVAEHLDSPEYLALLRELDAFVAEPAFTGRAAKPAGPELAAAIARDWRNLAEAANAALADPENRAGIHRARKRAKTVRYAAECAAATLGDDAVLFASAIEEVQEVLGEHQDALQAADLLVQLANAPDTDGVAGFIFGRLHAVEQALAHGALDDFTDAWDRVEDGDLVAALGR